MTTSPTKVTSLIPAQRTGEPSAFRLRASRSAVRNEGAIVPRALLAQLEAGTLGSAESRSPSSYHLVGTETVRDAASRSWAYLRPAWQAWREAAGERPMSVRQTREQWLLPLLRELGYGQVPVAGGLSVDGTDYPVSHLWQNVPVHLLGPEVDLDRRNPGVAGAARAPQAMLQEFLNRSDEHLWALLSNGNQLRLLRDSTSLSGATYLEFDLEAIFEGDQFAEWLSLFRLCHVSRLEVRGGSEAGPSDCWLEQWRSEAGHAGARALERLRGGVERAISTLGAGFVSHPDNGWLVAALRDERLSKDDYHRALLRLVYRLLFLFVAEDRELLLDPACGEKAKERYEEYFSSRRLRHQSRTRLGSSHADLWQNARLVLRLLGDKGLPELALPALGGLFERDDRQPDVTPESGADLFGSAELSNSDLLAAVRHLAWIEDGKRVVPVDFRHLGAEELGGVYESLLELVPELDVAGRTYRLDTQQGNDRKTTGSYYTPPSLVSALLDSTLDPVIEEAAPSGADPVSAEAALLALTVCDPACGSGGFLVAAARRIAQRLAEVRAGDDQASADEFRHALREVISRSVYGVDLNDLALELAKVSLWLESMVPGMPLTFLDSHLRVGNALLGATPALLKDGVPDDAFKALEGDDKKAASQARKRNAAERKQKQDTLPNLDVLATLVGDYTPEQRNFGEVSYTEIEKVRDARTKFQQRLRDPRYLTPRLQADAWCSAFVWPLHFGPDAVVPPTTAVIRRLAHPEHGVPALITDEVARLRQEFRFFHWHLEFPEVFAREGEPGPDGWAGGFSCIIGNPPWERVKLQEQEFFASRDPEIAKAPNKAARDRLIKRLATEDPALYAAFIEARRAAEGQSAFLRLSGRFPLNGRGDVNTYSVFAELFRTLVGPRGQCGIITPTGIATDATTQHFFKDLVATKSLVTLIDFENSQPIFDGVHRSFKFCLLVTSGRELVSEKAEFAFFLHDPSQIAGSTFSMTPEEITLLNPNTGTCPIFRSRRDAEITLGIYRRVPVLIKEGDPDGNPWGISFMRMFDMSNDSHLFRTRDELERDGWTLRGNIFTRGTGPAQERMLPLYEAKMIHHYDDRWATYERDDSIRPVTHAEKSDPTFAPMPRYWVSSAEVDSRLADWPHSDRLFGFRDITRATNERTVICSPIPRVGVGNNLPIILITPESTSLLQAILSSFILDYVARLKAGGVHLNFYIANQLAIPRPDQLMKTRFNGRETLATFITSRVEGLQFRSFTGERRDAACAEIDAVCFHQYGIARNEVDYIMETFPNVKKKDVATYGSFRTKELILEAYDRMQRAIETGAPYEPPNLSSPRPPSPTVQDGRDGWTVA